MIIIHHIGAYFLMLQKVFRRFVKWSVLKELIIKDIDALIIGSIGIVAFISFFVGGVVAIQTALNLTNPFLPQYLIGFATRQSVILEFAPTFISIIMAGKVGSFITSSLGTMRVTEQIEALKVMGINTYNYLIFPKIVAMFFYPFVIVVSMFLGIIGGYFASIYGGFLQQRRLHSRHSARFHSVPCWLCFFKNNNIFLHFGNCSLLSRLFP